MSSVVRIGRISAFVCYNRTGRPPHRRQRLSASRLRQGRPQWCAVRSRPASLSRPAGCWTWRRFFARFFSLQNGRSVDAASSYWRVVLTSGGGFHRGGVGDQPPVWASSSTFPRRFGPSTATPSGTWRLFMGLYSWCGETSRGRDDTSVFALLWDAKGDRIVAV